MERGYEQIKGRKLRNKRTVPIYWKHFNLRLSLDQEIVPTPTVGTRRFPSAVVSFFFVFPPEEEEAADSPSRYMFIRENLADETGVVPRRPVVTKRRFGRVNHVDDREEKAFTIPTKLHS